MAVSTLNSLQKVSSGLRSVGQDKKKIVSNVDHSQYAKKVVLNLFTEGPFQTSIPKDHHFTFPINPEEFDYTRPERVQVIQTLGDPFVDEFGTGLATLSIKGTTGWRLRPSLDNIDGYEAFRRLHRDFIDQYFKERENKLAKNQDPNDIALIIINNVDDMAYEVIPKNFRLLRNKTKPLLYQYEILFGVLKDLGDIQPEINESDHAPGKKNWLQALVERVHALINKLAKFASPYCQAIANVIDKTVSVLKAIKTGVGNVANFIHGVTSVIKTALDAIRDTQAFIQNLALDAIMELNELSSVLGEFNCYLKNGIKESWLPDLSGICGVSDCATTHGIKSGPIADGTGSSIEWVINMQESAKRNNSSSIIGVHHNTDYLENNFDDSDAAIIVDSSLDSHLTQLNQTAQNPTSGNSSLKTALQTITDTIGCIDIDPTRLPEEDDTKNLQKISQLKIIKAKKGDTLKDIAYREYKDVDRWYDIAAANEIVIESINELLAPMTTYTVNTNLYIGSNKMVLAASVPSNYAEIKNILILQDAEGHWQRLTVKSIDDKTIEFYETFSQNYTGPLTVTRMTNLAEFGVYDSATTLAAAFTAGSKQLTLTEVKNVYAGYVLYIRDKSESRSYTVTGVDYLNKKVEVEQASIGFAQGAKVEIYNQDTDQIHLTPGIELKIPVTTGDQNINQTAAEIYGMDLQTDTTGLLLVDYGSFLTVSGLPNLEQAITHRLYSRYGSLKPHPKYGCGLLDFLGSKNTPGMQTTVKAIIIYALNHEPRLNRTSKFKTLSVGDSAQFSIEVESVNNNTPTDLNFVIGGTI